jgi:hypothetical protein
MLPSIVQGELNVLKFWKNHATEWPRLVIMAKDFLSIMPSSTPSEELFSSAANFISKKRNRLKNETGTIAICLKSWEKKIKNE